MNRDLDNKNRVLVGLMITFALLIFCTSVAWTERETSDFWTKYVKKPVEQNIAKLESEDETEEVVLTADTPMIALTFDDGPGQYTDELLNVLEENDAKATFFVLGSNVVKYPETIKRMDALGYEIGNHSYYHPKLTDLSGEQVYYEIEWTNDAVQQIVGYRTELVRPTYGAINDTVKANVAYPLALWSVDTTDWGRKDAGQIANYILTTVKDGDVILLHDIHDFTLEAMKIVIPALKAQGYELVTFSEMAQIHGVTMVNGEKYFKFE